MSGFNTIAKGGGVFGNTTGGNASVQTQFGELAVAQLTPSSQTIFVHGVKGVGVVTASNGSSAFVTGVLSNAVLQSGVSSEGYAEIAMRRGLKYRAGQGSLTRLTTIFGEPVVDTNQLVGCGNAESGFYFGYRGTNFGIFHKTDGQREVRRLTISTGVATSTSVTITLDGNPITVSVAGGGTVNQTSWEISQKDYTKVGYGWFAEAHDGQVDFISMVAGPRTGSYSATGGTLAAAFSRLIEGVNITESFVSQSQWNIDKFDGSGPSRMVLDTSLGNVYQIGFQYLGYGNTRFAIEDLKTGQFQNCHMIEQANHRLRPVLKDPHITGVWRVENSGSVVGNHLTGTSGAIFTEGNVLRNIGPAFSTSAVKASINNDIETYVMSIRADRIYDGRSSYGELDLSSLTSALTVVGNDRRRGIVRIYKNARITGPVNFTRIDSVRSCASKDTSGTGLTLNNGILVASYVIYTSTVAAIELTGDNYFLSAGETLSFTVESSDNADEFALALSWFEDQ